MSRATLGFSATTRMVMGDRSVETTTLLSYQKAGVTVGTAKKSIAIVPTAILFALKPDLAAVDHRESVL